MKADKTRCALAEALVCLGGCAAELAVLNECDLERHQTTDLKRCRDALWRCEGEWNADLHEMLLYVVRDFLKSHTQAVCHLGRSLARYQRFKGSDVQSMLTAIGGVDALLVAGQWEADLLCRLKAVNTRLEDQLHYKAAYHRFIELSAGDAEQRRKAMLAYAQLASVYLKLYEVAELEPRLQALEASMQAREGSAMKYRQLTVRLEEYRRWRNGRPHHLSVCSIPGICPTGIAIVGFGEELPCACGQVGCPEMTIGILVPAKAPSVEAWAQRAQAYYAQRSGSHA